MYVYMYDIVVVAAVVQWWQLVCVVHGQWQYSCVVGG